MNLLVGHVPVKKIDPRGGNALSRVIAVRSLFDLVDQENLDVFLRIFSL